MKFDFSVPMTVYEFLAIVLSAIAIMIPIFQAIWKKWIIKEKLNFLPTGRIALFFNQSGSYIRVDGVYEAENKPISVKNISIKATRHKDDRKLNLNWISFISPVNQSVASNVLFSNESAHPFRIEANSITTAFTEFGDSFDSFGKNFRACTAPLFNRVGKIRNSGMSYEEALAQYRAFTEYSQVKDLLRKEFFWEIGKYDLDIAVSYREKTVHFCYTFSVGEYEQNHLLENCDEALITPLKSVYGVALNYQTAYLELHAK